MEPILESLEETQTIVLITVLILIITWESLHPFYEYFKGSVKDRGKHAFRNLLLGGINGLMVSVLFAGLWFAATVWADEHRFGLMHWFQDAAGLPVWAHAIGAILLLDLWLYTWHRMNHEIPFFWRFHSVHHSDNKMDVTTASRFHIGEIFFSSIIRIFIIAFFGVYLWEIVLYEIGMFAVVMFHHANVGLSEKYDRILRTVIVTPNMHRVHHSSWQLETDSNYSSLFSFWDRLARTFRLNPKPESIRLGLDQLDKEEDQTVKGMLKTPFDQRVK